jgi:hypothetical protein
VNRRTNYEVALGIRIRVGGWTVRIKLTVR